MSCEEVNAKEALISMIKNKSGVKVNFGTYDLYEELDYISNNGVTVFYSQTDYFNLPDLDLITKNITKQDFILFLEDKLYTVVSIDKDVVHVVRYFEEIVNLTHHAIKDIRTNTIIEPSGNVAKVECTVVPTMTVCGHQLFDRVFGNCVGLPEYDKYSTKLYLVSVVVMNHLQHTRSDLISPGKIIRDTDNKVIGCNGFNLFA